jgi:hypothetical protein
MKAMCISHSFALARSTWTTAEQQRFKAALKAVPEPFRTAHLERTVVVSAGSGELKIQLPGDRHGVR